MLHVSLINKQLLHNFICPSYRGRKREGKQVEYGETLKNNDRRINVIMAQLKLLYVLRHGTMVVNNNLKPNMSESNRFDKIK